MSHELFVYWRCESQAAAVALKAAARMQATLRDRCPGLSARLYQRVDDGAESATLMETYTGWADAGFEAMLEEAASDALARWCLGPRHLERFAEQVTDGC